MNDQNSRDDASRESRISIGPVQDTSATEWWDYVVDGNRRGPVLERNLIDKIKSGELGRETKIWKWKEGLPRWILLENTPFREFIPKAGPPPLDQVDTKSRTDNPPYENPQITETDDNVHPCMNPKTVTAFPKRFDFDCFSESVVTAFLGSILLVIGLGIASTVILWVLVAMGMAVGINAVDWSARMFRQIWVHHGGAIYLACVALLLWRFTRPRDRNKGGPLK